MRRPLAVSSAAAHRELLAARHGARRARQADAVTDVEHVSVAREISNLAARIARYEELIARLPDEMPWKAGRTRIKLGGASFDLFLSTKPELRALVGILKSRLAALAGAEGGRRTAAAEALSAHLAGRPKARPRPPAEEADQEPDPPAAPKGRWG